jgi:hypothetical protein
MARWFKDRAPARPETPWQRKQKAVAPDRYYGDGGTIHASGTIDIQVDADGRVVAVWFRCQNLPWCVSLQGSGQTAYADLDGGPAVSGVVVQR